MTSKFVKPSKHCSIIKEQIGNLAYVNKQRMCSPFFTSAKSMKYIYSVFEYKNINGTADTTPLIKYITYAPEFIIYTHIRICRCTYSYY
jgi:hypothetical protein